jgi:hypothetical protein
MRIIEIVAQENGAHRNQTGSFSIIPDGWALIPATVEIPPSFPFVDIEVKGKVVISMTARDVPEVVEEYIPTARDDADAMLVDHEYRITLLELGITE